MKQQLFGGSKSWADLSTAADTTTTIIVPKDAPSITYEPVQPDSGYLPAEHRTPREIINPKAISPTVIRKFERFHNGESLSQQNSPEAPRIPAIAPAKMPEDRTEDFEQRAFELRTSLQTLDDLQHTLDRIEAEIEECEAGIMPAPGYGSPVAQKPPVFPPKYPFVDDWNEIIKSTEF